MNETGYDPTNGDHEADTTAAQTRRRKTKRERAIEEGYDPTHVPLPPPYPLDEALADAYDPDPGNDDKSAILAHCQPDPHPIEVIPRQTPSTGWVECEWQADAREIPAAADAVSGNPETAVTLGQGNPATLGQGTPETLGHRGLPPATQESGSARETPDAPPLIPPETLAAELQRLPQWQARYVLALMEHGGVVGLACRKVSVSRQSVAAAQAASPAFLQACADAVAHSTDLVEAAVFRGATIGDTVPVYQGGLLVGYKRVRSVKDAELLLRLRGKIDAPETPEAGRRAAGRQPVAPETVGQIVAGTLKALFEARQQQQ